MASPDRTGLRYAWYALAVLFVINCFNYIDRLVLSALLPEIQSELGLSDSQGGLLFSAFVAMLALAAIPAGRLADAWRRKNVVAIGVALWSAATIASAAAGRFVTLLAARALVGIGEASCVPAAVALIGDYFPKTHRVRAISVFGAAMLVGSAIGLVVGKIVGEQLGWRTTLILFGSPGLLLALWAFSLREPRPGATEDAAPERTRELPRLSIVFNIPTLRTMTLGVAILTAATSGLIHWLMVFMERVRFIPAERAGIVGGAPAMAGCLLGVLASGWITEALARRHRSAIVWSVGLSMIAATPFLAAFLLLDAQAAYLAALFGAGFCLSWAIAPVGALIHSLVEPRLRGAAVGAFTLLIHVGDFISPALIGSLSDLMGGKDVPDALRHALFIVPVLALAGGLVCLRGARTVEADMDAMQERLRGGPD